MSNTQNTKHPLSFFIYLIEDRGFTTILQNFSIITEVEDYQNEFAAYDKVSEKKIYENHNEEGELIKQEIPFEAYLNQLMIKEYKTAKKAIDTQILTLTEEASDNYIAKILLLLKYQADLLGIYPDANKYPIIKTYLEKIANSVSKKYITGEVEEETGNDFNQQTEYKRLRWSKNPDAFFALFATLYEKGYVESKDTISEKDYAIRLRQLFIVKKKRGDLEEYTQKTFIAYLKDSERNKTKLGDDKEIIAKLIAELDSFHS